MQLQVSAVSGERPRWGTRANEALTAALRGVYVPVSPDSPPKNYIPKREQRPARRAKTTRARSRPSTVIGEDRVWEQEVPSRPSQNGRKERLSGCWVRKPGDDELRAPAKLTLPRDVRKAADRWSGTVKATATVTRSAAEANFENWGLGSAVGTWDGDSFSDMTKDDKARSLVRVQKDRTGTGLGSSEIPQLLGPKSLPWTLESPKEQADPAEVVGRPTQKPIQSSKAKSNLLVADPKISARHNLEKGRNPPKKALVDTDAANVCKSDVKDSLNSVRLPHIQPVGVAETVTKIHLSVTQKPGAAQSATSLETGSIINNCNYASSSLPNSTDVLEPSSEHNATCMLDWMQATLSV